MKAVFEIEELGLFRKAKSTDIVEGNIVYLIGDNDILYKKTIEEVYRPNDDWKAFCADDGCRYGLYHLYVLIKGNEKQKRIDELEQAMRAIKSQTKCV